MLHIRNTLHKHKYLAFSRLLTITLCSTSDFTSKPPTVTRRNCPLHTELEGVENLFVFFLSFAVSRANSLPHRFFSPLLHQSVALLTRHFCDTLVLSQTQKLSSKATELTTTICLIQTRLTSLVGHTL